MWAAGQTQYVLRYIFDIISRSYGRRHGWHVAITTTKQGFLDFLWGAAVQPITIRQVGKTFVTTGIRGVALCAIVPIQALANRHGLRILGDIFGFHRHELGINRRSLCIALGNLVRMQFG